jgi:hypothetical protein
VEVLRFLRVNRKNVNEDEDMMQIRAELEKIQKEVTQLKNTFYIVDYF